MNVRDAIILLAFVQGCGVLERALSHDVLIRLLRGLLRRSR